MYDLAENINTVKCLQGNKIIHLKTWLIQQEKKKKTATKKKQQHSLLTVSSNWTLKFKYGTKPQI